MKKINQKTRFTSLVLASYAAIGSLFIPTFSLGQVSGGILGLSEFDGKKAEIPAFRVRTTPLENGDLAVSLVGDFQKGSPEAHAFVYDWQIGSINSLVGSDAADSLINKFDGGDGPDFDGGDGPDYVNQVTELVGSDAADSLINKFDGGDGPDFDGGDGPDYVNSVTELVGSDAADSLINKFDGGDGPDFDGGDGPDYVSQGNELVGSDAADSFIRTRIALQFTVSPAELPSVHRLACDLHKLINFAYDTFEVAIPANGLNSTGNEVAVFEDYGVSLKTNGNEVAIVQSLDSRSVEERWFEWGLLTGLDNAVKWLPLAAELDVLLWERELGLLNDREFAAEVETALSSALLIEGWF